MFENSMVVLAVGCESELFTYGCASGRVVLKVVCSSRRKEQAHLRNEFQLLKGLEHLHIIKALRYQEKVAFQGNTLAKQFVTKNILVLEFAQEGSLLAYLTSHSLPLTLKKTLFVQLLSALRYLHSLRIAHRDLKLENVLLSLQDQQLIIKLSDFGFAAHFEKEGQRITFNEFKGTRKGYMAPEIHACHHAPEKRYDAPMADVFALGVLLFALVMGKLPFQLATPENKLYGLIAQGKLQDFWAFHHQVNGIFSEEPLRMQQFQSLFQRMVSFKAEERPTAQEVGKDDWLV